MHRALLSIASLALILALAAPAHALAQATDGQDFAPQASTSTPAAQAPGADSPELDLSDLEKLLGPFLGDLEARPANEPPPGRDAEPVPAPPAAPLLTREDRIQEAAEEFEEKGLAPVVGLPTGQVEPFGEAVPEIVCLPLRACDLELQGGEVIDGLVLGDPERWSSEFLFEGPESDPIPHIVLKPAARDLRTNAVVVTSRRTYHFELRSPAKDDPEPTAYHHHVSWWYPQDWVRRVRSERAEKAARTSRPPGSPVERPLDLAALNFAYRTVEPHKAKHRLPWQPVTVFDDGTRTFLRLPPEASRSDLPAVLGQLEDGSTYPLDSKLADQWLVVPEVATRLELALGTGKSRRSLTLVNLGAAR